MQSVLPTSRREARIASVFASALLALPFVQPLHRPPMLFFESEWLAVALGLALCAALLPSPRLAWPRLAWAPLLLAAWIAVQPLLVAMPYPQTAVAPALVCVWGAALIAAGHGLRRLRPDPDLWDALAGAMLAGAVLGAIVGAAQVLAPGWGPVWLVYEDAGTARSAAGNLRHQGHHALHLGWGLVALVWLHARERLRAGAFLGGLLILAPALAMTSQRAALVYALALLPTAWLLRARDEPSFAQRLRRSAGMAGVMAVVAMLLWAVVAPMLSATATPGALQRSGNDGGLWIRLPMWESAWRMFLQAPWTGLGVDGYTAFHLDHAAASPHFRYTTHAHNAPLHLLATVGLAGVAPLAWLAWRWLRNLAPGTLSTKGFLPVGLLAVFVACCMVETPTHMTYFLGPAALLLGMTCGAARGTGTPSHPAGRWLLAGMVACGVSVLAWTLAGFQALSSPWSKPMKTAQMLARFESAARHPVFAAVAESVQADFVGLKSTSARDLERARRVAAWRPAEKPLYRLAALLALRGQPKAARETLDRAMRAFPAGLTRFAQNVCGQRSDLAEPLRELLRYGASRRPDALVACDAPATPARIVARATSFMEI